jgi:glycosyltransferase involved in cell wall biosynthesis
MALGLPVVSTHVGGIPYLIEDNTDGLLVPPDNAGKFTEQIDRLIADKNLVLSLTQNARSKVNDFDWEILKHKWFNLLDPLIKK